jgi:hypothetical protein
MPKRKKEDPDFHDPFSGRIRIDVIAAVSDHSPAWVVM